MGVPPRVTRFVLRKFVGWAERSEPTISQRMQSHGGHVASLLCPPYCTVVAAYRAWCTLLRKRWIIRSVRDDQLSPSPRRISRMRCLIGWTSAAALARIAMMNS